MERTAFLDRVRANLARPTSPNLPHPMPALGGPVPPVRYSKPITDAVARFVEMAAAVGATVTILDDDSDVDELVREVMEKHNVQRAVRSNDPEARLVSHPSVMPFDGPATAAGADLGITGAAYAIAATGTLVLHSGRAGGRTAGLLPPVHLALVRRNRVLADSGELLRKLPERFPDGLPSQLVLATGPSRSADIELVITVGVHGPGHVWIAVLPDEESGGT